YKKDRSSSSAPYKALREAWGLESRALSPAFLCAFLPFAHALRIDCAVPSWHTAIHALSKNPASCLVSGRRVASVGGRSACRGRSQAGKAVSSCPRRADETIKSAGLQARGA